MPHSDISSQGINMAMSNEGARLKTSSVQGPLPQMQGGQMPHPGVRRHPAIMQGTGHEEYSCHRNGQRVDAMSGQQQQRLQTNTRSMSG